VSLVGLFIWEQDSQFFSFGGTNANFNIPYVLPVGMSSGAHRITAFEGSQDTLIPYADFTITPAPPPGQVNVSFSSVPVGAQITVDGAYVGNAPVTVPLIPGTHAVSALDTVTGETKTLNIQVYAGSGSQSVPFTFAAGGAPFDLMAFLKANQWYIIGGAAGIVILAVALKNPTTVRRGVKAASNIAQQGYSKAKEALT
jgi:hypothetical protein